jgi:hypothetical protein
VAGVDCIDCSADPAVVLAVRDGVDAAIALSQKQGAQEPAMRPWIMVSINDDEDPHFRKAYFDPDVGIMCMRACMLTYMCVYASITTKTLTFFDPDGMMCMFACMHACMHDPDGMIFMYVCMHALMHVCVLGLWLASMTTKIPTFEKL